MCEAGNIHYNLASIDPTNGNSGQASTDEKQSNANGTKREGSENGTKWDGIGEQGIATCMYSVYIHGQSCSLNLQYRHFVKTIYLPTDNYYNDIFAEFVPFISQGIGDNNIIWQLFYQT